MDELNLQSEGTVQNALEAYKVVDYSDQPPGPPPPPPPDISEPYNPEQTRETTAQGNSG